MATTQGAHDVLLVGSVPLESAEAVFRAVSDTVGTQVRRIPDGETGVRSGWIGWQAGVFMQTPMVERVPQTQEYAGLPQFRVRPGVTHDDVTFGPLGYAAAARESYAVFARMQAAGEIPAPVRFQVSLPTPLAPLVPFFDMDSQRVVEPAYERQMLTELAEICAAVPHDKLAIQWDVAIEMAVWEGVWHAWFENDDKEGGIITRLVRLGMAVPGGVELGYHLCYGDAGHQHFVQPTDTANLVRVANAIAAGMTRPIQWLHMPVPRERDDDAYFAPLTGLHLHPETALYLGLVHLSDGAEGTKRRIAAARKHAPDFGIGTECGFGRRPPETVVPLLQVHADVTR